MSKTDNHAETFSAEQLETLRAEFATAPKRISYEHADRILALLDRVNPTMMQQLADADVRFVSEAARGRLLRQKHGLA